MPRCVLVVDVDAFYVQVEELREPALRQQPLAVFQKFLLITCNYPARARGVTKLMRKEEALAKCPELILKSAEDTTPYRNASKNVLQTLEAWANKQEAIVERLGMDEYCIDISSSAARLASEAAECSAHANVLAWSGHIYRAQGADAVTLQPAEVLAGRDRCFRPMDLRAASSSSSADIAQVQVHKTTLRASATAEEVLLASGTHLASEVRQAILQSTGLRTSAGIAQNRLLAKFAAGIHKPNAQTVLLSTEASAFLSPLPATALPGVGRDLAEKLNSHGIHTIGDLRHSSVQTIEEALQGVKGGAATAEVAAARLFELAHGNDERPVRPTRPPGRISVEDSFRKCGTQEGIQMVLSVLAPDLLTRLQEDSREAKRLTVSWRYYGSRTMNNPEGSTRNVVSRSIPFPALAGLSEAKAAAHLASCAEKVISGFLGGNSFHLTRINLAASGFVAMTANGSSGKQQLLMCSLGINQNKATPADQLLRQASFDPCSADTAAATSASYRNDYNGDRPKILLSKSEERLLREQQLAAATTLGGDRLECPVVNAETELVDVLSSSDDDNNLTPSSVLAPSKNGCDISRLDSHPANMNVTGCADTSVAKNAVVDSPHVYDEQGEESQHTHLPLAECIHIDAVSNTSNACDDNGIPSGHHSEELQAGQGKDSFAEGVKTHAIGAAASSIHMNALAGNRVILQERDLQLRQLDSLVEVAKSDTFCGGGSPSNIHSNCENHAPAMDQHEHDKHVDGAPVEVVSSDEEVIPSKKGILHCEEHKNDLSHSEVGAAASKRRSSVQCSLDAFFGSRKARRISYGLPIHDAEEQEMPTELSNIDFQSRSDVPGLYILANFLSESEETSLVKWLDTGPPEWKRCIFNGECRSKNWGVRTDLLRRTVRPADPNAGENDMPLELLALAERLNLWFAYAERSRKLLEPSLAALLHDFRPNEANANEYVRKRGDSLTPHFDDRFLSGPVLAGLSLLSDSVMTYHEHPSGRASTNCAGCCACTRRGPLSKNLPCGPQQRVYLPRRSLQLVTGRSRFDFTHSIHPEDLPAEGRRLSVVFRQARCPWPSK